MRVCAKPEIERSSRCSRCVHSIPHQLVEETDNNRNAFMHCDHVNRVCPACIEVKEIEFLTTEDMTL